MSQVPVWFERKFDFSFPVELLWLARVNDYAASRDQLTAADVANRKTLHLYFVAEHDDHHLAQTWELVNAIHAFAAVDCCNPERERGENQRYPTNDENS